MNEPPFDPRIADELTTILGPAGADSLRRAFFDELRTAPAIVAGGFASGDGTEGRAAAHRLKGAALVIGACAVANAADRLEFADHYAVEDALAHFAIAIDRTIAATEMLPHSV